PHGGRYGLNLAPGPLDPCRPSFLHRKLRGKENDEQESTRAAGLRRRATPGHARRPPAHPARFRLLQPGNPDRCGRVRLDRCGRNREIAVPGLDPFQLRMQPCRPPLSNMWSLVVKGHIGRAASEPSGLLSAGGEICPRPLTPVRAVVTRDADDVADLDAVLGEPALGDFEAEAVVLVRVVDLVRL